MALYILPAPHPPMYSASKPTLSLNSAAPKCAIDIIPFCEFIIQTRDNCGAVVKTSNFSLWPLKCLYICCKTVSYTHLRAHETKANLVCRLLLEKKKQKK